MSAMASAAEGPDLVVTLADRNGENGVDSCRFYLVRSNLAARPLQSLPVKLSTTGH